MRRHKSGANALTRRNFSLIEMLATIAIIAVLAGLSFGAYRAIQKGQAKTKTEATVNAIHIALQAFKNKYGYYPQAPDPVALVFCKEKATTGDATLSGENILKNSQKLVLGKDFTTFLGSQVMKNAVIKDGTITINLKKEPVYILTESYKDPVTNCSILDNVSKKANLIYYKCPGAMNQESYDLFSAGPDRKFGDYSGASPDKNSRDDIWPQGLKRRTENN